MADAERVVGRFLAALGERDFGRARTFWADDATWHITGTNALSGDYSPDRYLATLRQWFADHPGYTVELTEVRSHGPQGIVVHVRSQGGSAPEEAWGILAYRVQDGLIAEGWAIATFADGRFPF